jgi:hypothetical protein
VFRILLGAVPAIAGLLALAGLAHREVRERRGSGEEVEPHVTLPSPAAARVLSLGHNELAADLVWLRTLIYYGDGLVHEHGMPDVEKLIATINRLDPWFRRPYVWGAHATTFRRGDASQEEYQASVEILRRAVAIFPRDWELAWLLGLRLFYDLEPGNEDAHARLREEGAMWIERAMRMPDAPDDLPILAAALRTRLGQKERALRELREMILVTEDDAARAKLEERYAVLASEDASAEIASEARKLDSEWREHLPYAPRSLYLILGPRPPPAFDLKELSARDDFHPTADL